MIICFDGSRFSSKPTGVTNIGISIINAFVETGLAKQIIVFMNADMHPEVDKLISKSDLIRVIVSPFILFPKIKLLWSLFKLNLLVNKAKPDLFICPNFLISPFFLNRKIKTTVYIHDLVIKEFPKTMEVISRIQMTLQLKYSLKRSNIIWCNSNYTKNVLDKHYHSVINKKQIFVGAGINSEFYKESKKYDATKGLQNLSKFVITKPYILFVGTTEPRKNISFLLELYKELSYRFELIIVGMSGWGENYNKPDLLNLSHKDNIKFTGYVSNEELISLYKNAELLISTSLNEGLGLPMLEAMICGCPVITAHNSAMVEVVEGAGVTVKGWDKAEWLNCIELLIANKELYIDKGYNRTNKYLWKDIVNDFIEFIH